MGNEAIAWGLLEAGCTLAASYPGTPASEILAAMAAFSRETGVKLHAEWSLNEKVAYEVALGHSYTGLRAAVAMKQVGLNVASDPFLRSAYLGVKGGLLVIVADDPGPHSSQTEQDSRFFALFGKIPVLDPVSPRQAKEMVAPAFDLSEKYELPVMLRPTTRVCHARQPVACNPPLTLAREPEFVKNPARWCATPQFLRDLHRGLNDKIAAIAQSGFYPPVLTPGDGSFPKTVIIASGVAFAHTWDWLAELGLLGRLDLYQVPLPYPLAPEFIEHVYIAYQHILVLEETYPVIERQLAHRGIQGRLNRSVPTEGELTPDVIQGILGKFLDLPPLPSPPPPGGGARPTLCAGCGHRAAFYGIRETFPDGIFPSDIGCYTLGMNLGAVDTVHCMGAGISQAAGLYHAFHTAGRDIPPIVATIGDSTFFHAGIPALINAVVQQARFILVILDNATTAMTGHQPVPHLGLTARGEPTQAVPLEDLIRACGVRFLEVMDPYQLPEFMALLQRAAQHTRDPQGGVAVIIARHPCLLDKAAPREQIRHRVEVTASCIACHHCLENFECPALKADPDTGQVRVDQLRCVGCRVCVHVCPAGAIEIRE
ncbi:MAG: indolepyruvate oxidoreductase [Deltaproteobacteria bacterium]|nr:indolepyruvate oxidoreductase [Deltaproteobacteria bacterium]